MTTTPPPLPPGAGGAPPDPSGDPPPIETFTQYDQAKDAYHCSYGPPIPGVTVHDTERDLLVRVDPSTHQVIGFTIPNFKAWYADHADADGSFDVELPSLWGVEPDEQ